VSAPAAGRRRSIGDFLFPPEGDVRADIAERYGYAGELLDIYAANKGAVVHKWHHYLPLYDRYFGAWRGRPVRFLEIGVAQGGSLQMWRRWFGPAAVIYGIDIHPNCARFDGQAGRVRVGSQADPAFLEAVVAEMGGVDLVLDDGSHRMEHVRASLEALFPRLAVGGTYMIEDLHTAYLPKYGGGYHADGNFFNAVRQLIDDMHSWYHACAPHHAALSGLVTGVHVHDSIVVLEKGKAERPTHSRVGGEVRRDG
jgi:cephalosporin hydroxylase